MQAGVRNQPCESGLALPLYLRWRGSYDAAGSSSIALKHIGYILRFLWNATRGHHLAPWRSPYLLWRIETYTGIKMQSIGFLEFCGFSWRERVELMRFLTWTGEMERYARARPKNP